MKSIRVIIALIGLVGAGSALAGGFGMSPFQSNYQQFITGYKGDIIDTRLNTVTPAFVYEATKALRADGVSDLRNPDIATYLWRSIDNVVNYYANLPVNRNNRDFKTRIWQSLLRNLDELARVQQPMIQPVIQPVVQQPTRQPLQLSASDGLAALREFKLQTSRRIEMNPTHFFSAGAIQPSWLREALYVVTARGGIPITMQNKLSIQKELAQTATELMEQVLRKDGRNLSEQQKNNIIQMVLGQVEQFINAQTMYSRI